MRISSIFPASRPAAPRRIEAAARLHAVHRGASAEPPDEIAPLDSASLSAEDDNSSYDPKGRLVLLLPRKRRRLDIRV